MRVSIAQPAYLPWLGYFDRIERSEMHVVLDHVPLGMRSFVNRNKVRTQHGWTWLTVPLQGKRKHEIPISAIRPVEGGWADKHLATLLHSYRKAPHFTEVEPVLRAVLTRRWDRLASLLRRLTGELLAILGIDRPLAFSSEMGLEKRKDELLLEICRAVGATTYVSGPLGRDYIRRELFEDAGVALVFHDYEHPQYRQLHEPFLSHMSVVDLIFNHGPSSKEILLTGGRVS